MDSTKHTRNITEQLSQLRDLLIVIERSDDAPDVLYKIAIEKSQHITSLVEAWRAEADPTPVEIPAEYAMWIEGDNAEVEASAEASACANDFEPETEVTVQPAVELDMIDIEVSAPDDEALLDNLQERADEDEYIAPFVEDNSVKEQSIEVQPTVELSVEVEPEAEVETTPEVVIESAPEPIELPQDDSFFFHDEPVQEEQATDEVAEWTVHEEICDEDVAIATDEIEVVDYDVVESETVIEEFEAPVVYDDEDDDDERDDVNESPEEEVAMDEFYNRGEPFDNDTITVGELMSVRQAKELRKAFSLNDRFRFRRELFGNNDVNMNETLNLIDAMSDYNEAVEYLVQDLGWSLDEPVVQEFLQLIERHFKQS
ncbi:MAG: hypothetical protein J6U43_00125 [Bacteroidales bacterium]|nr:hypothetical protein [Bacteroidales bacterium]